MKSFDESTFIEKIENYNSLLGCIYSNGNYNFYLMPVAWWILDYKKYDPEHSSDNNSQFRNNIYTLTESNKNQFIESIKEDKISIEDIKSINEHYKGTDDIYYSRLSFFISFDNNIYINGFYDLELEDYLPEKWTGKFDEPIKYLPIELQKLWC